MGIFSAKVYIDYTDIQPKIRIDEMSSMAILWVLNTNMILKIVV